MISETASSSLPFGNSAIIRKIIGLRMTGCKLVVDTGYIFG